MNRLTAIAFLLVISGVDAIATGNPRHLVLIAEAEVRIARESRPVLPNDFTDTNDNDIPDTGSRPGGHPDGASPPQPRPTDGAGRESAHKRRVLIATASWCLPCGRFWDRNGRGNADVELVPVDVGNRPAGLTDAEWSVVWNSVYSQRDPDVDRQLPLAVWQTDNGRWVAKTVSGWSMSRVELYVKGAK